MIHKNLTPFFWGPKVTARKPPQVELAVCVRAVLRLEPGAPLEVIEDPIAQGFMTGDAFAEDDLDQTGELLYASDFADYKLNAEVLLKGTCYPPGGSANRSAVRFTVGSWSKSLNVVGPRVFRPGMLMGGSLSDPEPFAKMPLGWSHAYGGEGYPTNPVGRGFATEEMPTVESPDAPVKKKGAKGIEAGSFGPISPNWPQRAGKRGKRYGADWKRKRAPFFAEDFDWTYFHAGPPDQQLPGYLRGDEELVFENMHPDAPVWKTALPGLRVRAFVKTLDGVVREPTMCLDTLYADLDDGKLYLTWRGLSPIQEIDMTDVGVVLIASESLTEEPKPLAEYVAQLEAFEDDPVGLKEGYPPGFVEFTSAVEAFEHAELHGEPLPDLKAVAESLPDDCPFPKWFLAAVAGEGDPLGIEAKFPGDLAGDDPLGIKEKMGDLADPKKAGEALAAVPEIKNDPSTIVGALGGVVGLLPGELQEQFAGNLEGLESALAKAEAAGGDDFATQMAAAAGEAQAPASAADDYAALVETTEGALGGMKDRAATLDGAAQEAALSKVAGAEAQLADVPSTLDEAVTQALQPLEDMPLPELPDMPDVEAEIEASREALVQQEERLRAAVGDDPTLGLFALGHRLLDNAPRVEDVAPDMTPMVDGLKRAEGAFLERGVSPAALAPLTGFIGRLEALVDEIPKPPPLPEGEFVRRDLRGRDFSGQDLAGKSFAKSDLTGADLSDANLVGADLRGVDLTGANLTRADLSQADLSGSTLAKAILVEATASGANLNDADLNGSDLTSIDLEGAHLEQVRGEKAILFQAKMVGADLRFCDLSKSDLREVNLAGADLSFGVFDLVNAERGNFSSAKLDLVKLTKSRLAESNFSGVESGMGSFAGSDLTGAGMQGCRLEKVDFMKAILDRADLSRATLRQVNFRDVQAHGTNFQGSDVAACTATGEASFKDASFVGVRGARSIWMDVDVSGANWSGARLRNAYFQGAHGDRADFTSAVLAGACFRKANLTRACFSGADLCSADFNGAQLDGGDFRGSNCYDAKFLQARAVACDFEDANLEAVQLDDPDAGTTE